jgi:hypothetical protein
LYFRTFVGFTAKVRVRSRVLHFGWLCIFLLQTTASVQDANAVSEGVGEFLAGKLALAMRIDFQQFG